AASSGPGWGGPRPHPQDFSAQPLPPGPARGRSQPPALLREHARGLAAADDLAESEVAAGRLMDYYLHTAVAAGQHIPTVTAVQGRPPPGLPPADSPDLRTPGQAAAWLETERANLYAAAAHAAAGRRTPPP